MLSVQTMLLGLQNEKNGECCEHGGILSNMYQSDARGKQVPNRKFQTIHASLRSDSLLCTTTRTESARATFCVPPGTMFLTMIFTPCSLDVSNSNPTAEAITVCVVRACPTLHTNTKSRWTCPARRTKEGQMKSQAAKKANLPAHLKGEAFRRAPTIPPSLFPSHFEVFMG